jgi:hypothetical protein
MNKLPMSTLSFYTVQQWMVYAKPSNPWLAALKFDSQESGRIVG